jgi:hypothetical protein
MLHLDIRDPLFVEAVLPTVHTLNTLGPSH